MEWIFGVGDWLARSFVTDPAGWLSLLFGVFGALALVMFKKTRDALVTVWRRVTDVRLVRRSIVNSHLAQARAEGRAELQAEIDLAKVVPIVPMRWEIGRNPEGSTQDWVLANFSSGIARDVTIEPVHRSCFSILSDGFFKEVDGKGMHKFEGAISDRNLAEMAGLSFLVEWTDINGQRTRRSIDANGWKSR